MGVPPIPFAHRSRYGDSIASLLAQRGDIAARGAAASGQIWGQAVGQLGQIGAQAFQGYQADKEAKRQEAELNKQGQALTSFLSNLPDNPEEILRGSTQILGPEGIKFAQNVLDFRSAAEKNQRGEAPTLEEFKGSAEGVASLYARAPGFVKENWATIGPTLSLGSQEHLGVPLGADWQDDYGLALESFLPTPEGPKEGTAAWLMNQPPEVKQAYLRTEQELSASKRAPEAPTVSAPPSTPWGKPFTGADGKSYQYNDQTGETRIAEGIGAKPETGTAAKGQRAEAQQNVNTILGSPDSEDRDSLYALAMRNTIPGDVGLVASATGLGGTIQKWTRMGSQRGDIELYESQKSGFIPLLARAVGHTGVLTEKDVERTEKLLPVLTGPYADTQAVAKRKLDRLRRIMAGQEKLPEGIFEYQEGVWPPPGQAVAELSSEMEALLAEEGY